MGPYQVISRLGSGGMGTVYLARAADGTQVAVKAIRRDFAADPVYRARFHEEVSNAQKVASFCTARVLDHGEDNGVLYLVTEYIDGVSLEDHLMRHGALPPSVLHSAAVGVAAALTAIHAAGLVHRDLKPANVMLTLAGPRVIDFGLARSTHVNARHTNAGMVMGTPGWIAPEQVFEGRTSPAADVFAWGSLVAYAGLGGHPFGEGDAYVMAARARTAPPDLRGLPAPLDRLVAAAIHPDPARRPAAKQLLLELVGAADEPGAQLAATKHLSSSWNPAELPAFPPPGQRVRQPPPPPGWSTTGQGPLPPPPTPGPSHGPAPSSHGPAPSSHGPAPSSHGPAPSSHGPAPSSHGPAPSAHGPAAPSHGPAAPSHAPAPGASRGPMPGPGHAPPPQHTVTGVPGPRPTMPPYAQAPVMPRPGFTPPRRRSRGLTGCLTALAIGLVLFVVLLAALAWLFGPAARSADGPIQDGILKFTITDATCPKPARDAKTRTCKIQIRVNNTGPEARVLYPGQQKLLDEDGTKHDAAKLLDKAGKEITPTRVEAGTTFTGTLLFTLPRGASPAEVELHDSALSRGARHDLP
ncbi:protein kinase [Nonomuraea sp. NPDC050556]|uniref:protein kinase domain-containing protein n=1 Tax=Nonomuraea sp. NPDC050556 TaxID=3364369 RepID=UPI003796A034